MLVAYLPPESSLARAMGWWWTDAHELTAQLVEIGAVAAQAAGATASGLSGRRWRPEPYQVPRPAMPALAAPPATAPEPQRLTRESIRRTLLRRG